MRPRLTIAPWAVAQALATTGLLAQPDLPPPPPPPLGQPTELPAPPPAPNPSRPTQSPAPPPLLPPASTTSPRRREPSAVGPSSPAAPPPPYRAGPTHHRIETYVVEGRRRRPLALTLSPMPLALGRLSVAAEVLLARHHALVASPNLIFAQVDRGGRYSLVSEGFGFASSASGSIGIELGYHYWWPSQESLRGFFLGPSLLLGDTSQPSVDASHARGYWGLACDIGIQEVLSSGLTIGGGAGLGVARMAGATALFPRLLFQVGWSL